MSYDWSNAKAQWAAAKPMDCEERLLSQAKMTKAQSKDTKVFVYRNVRRAPASHARADSPSGRALQVVKALPWFSSIREKLDDPQYAGWFLRFNGSAPRRYHVPDCAPENSSKCSVFCKLAVPQRSLRRCTCAHCCRRAPRRPRPRADPGGAHTQEPAPGRQLRGRVRLRGAAMWRVPVRSSVSTCSA